MKHALLQHKHNTTFSQTFIDNDCIEHAINIHIHADETVEAMTDLHWKMSSSPMNAIKVIGSIISRTITAFGNQ